jgi:hypothetical protein
MIKIGDMVTVVKTGDRAVVRDICDDGLYVVQRLGKQYHFDANELKPYIHRKYYIKAVGPTRYDETGIIFPVKIELDLSELVKQCGGYVCWEFQDHCCENPLVLCCSLSPDKADKLGSMLPNMLTVCEKTWREDGDPYLS